MKCWNLFCIAGDCDGENHLDPTGHTWTQKRGQVYCPAADAYVDPEDCIHN